MIGFYKKITLIALLVFVAMSCKNDDDGGAEDPKAENLKGLGASSEDLLSSDIYKSMTVELVFSENFRPTQETLIAFRTFLEERVNKPDGINFVETIIENQNGPFSIAQIRNIESEQRTRFTEGDDIAVYVYFASGSSNADTSTTVTLGTAYQNTSIVVYQRTLQNLIDDDDDLLRRLVSTTLHHEFGHLFGLVNIQDDDIHSGGEHEDLDHPKHCVVEDCLMYFEAQNITRTQLTRNMQRISRLADIPAFDLGLCIPDLQAKGGR